ncbi:hypothetical protein SASPL_143763 [Salvia splendens]|uniref:Alliinase C-terminal domain-containing protein n=1 Tax=Salvia splendens TaxID=180675 RepID=A0A8X8WN91_SALSN|nr:hypothetical protein SASPL_143763 [Salvia splendens]
MQKAPQVGDETLTSLFITGLQDPFKQELLTRRPVSLNEAFALAQQLAASRNLSTTTTATPKIYWETRDNRPARQIPALTTAPPRNPHPRNVGNALGWAFDEDDILTDELAHQHVESEQLDDDGENMVITGDVSSIHVISPKIKPRAIRLKGRINDNEVSILIDGGSTHNFIQPAVAERLSLCVHPIIPFRVFVGNGESLRCSHACLRTPITMQGYSFEIDLFILQVKGPDVILGVQWLQELGDVTKNYQHLTMKFDLGDRPIFLQGEGASPKQISYNNLFSLIGQEPECDMFELVSVPLETDADVPPTESQQPAIDPALAEVLKSFNMHGGPFDTPIHASEERVVQVDGLPQSQWLVHWSEDLANPTWEPKLELLQHFPNLSLVDKALPMWGGVDRDLPAISTEPAKEKQPDDQASVQEDRSVIERGRKKTREVGTRMDRPRRKKSIGEDFKITISASEALSYFSNPKRFCWFMLPKLKQEIRNLHNVVGNAVVEGRHIMVGNGSSQLIQAALYALAKPLDPQAPSTANGMFIHDLAYYCPQYTAITKPDDHEIMLFTASKCTRQASSRIEWAIVKDSNVAKQMVKFLEISTIGVSKEVQLRAISILEIISTSTNFFDVRLDEGPRGQKPSRGDEEGQYSSARRQDFRVP